MVQEELKIVIIIGIKEGRRDDLLAALTDVLAKSRTIEGCIEIIVHENITNPNTLLVYETWASEDLWHKYLMQPHITDFSERTKDFANEWVIHKLKKIEV